MYGVSTSCARCPASSDARTTSGVTGIRRNTSSPTASIIAASTAPTPAPTGGSPTPRAPTGVSGIGNVERGVTHSVRRHVEDGQRLVVVEAHRERHAVVLVVDRLLRQRVADPEAAAAEHLPAEAARIHDGADVRDRRVVEELVPSRSRRRLRLRRSR